MKKNRQCEQLIRCINHFLLDYDPNHNASSVHTCRSHETALKSYIDWLETRKNVTGNTLSAKHFETCWIEEWCQYLSHEKGMQNQSVNIRLASLRSFIKYLSKQDAAFLYLKGESENVSLLKAQKTKVTGISRDGIKAILAVPDSRRRSGRLYLVAIIICYNLALRIDELLSIKIKDIKNNGKRTYIIITGKGRKVRTLSLMPRTTEHLELYIREFHGVNPNPEAYLFYSNYKGPYEKMSQTSFRRQLKKYAETARRTCSDIPENVHPHMLRHARATHLLEDGLNLVQVSEILGHADISTTQIYLDISLELKERAMKQMESSELQATPKIWKTPEATMNLKDRIAFSHC